MRMPNVQISRTSDRHDIVDFVTDDGAVRGTAFRRHGENEAHYDVTDVHLAGATLDPTMRAVPGVLAAFDVLAPVTHVFEDGVSVVSVHGFEFWIDPEETATPLHVGDVVECRIERLTLYI